MTRKSLGNARGNIQVHQIADDGIYVQHSLRSFFVSNR